MKNRAIVRNENASVERWFVYVESSYSGAIYAARFSRRSSAEAVAKCINRAFKLEGRLYEYDEP